MPRAPRTTDPPASPATALIDDESLRSLGDADGRVIVIDGVRVVANHHRSSSWMDDAETKDDATTLRRSRSAGSDARSDHRGWFAKALARTFSSTMRIEEEAEREEGGVGTASGRRDEEGEEDEEDEEEKTPTSTPTSTPRKDARPSDDDDETDDDETDDDDEDEDEDDERTPDEFHPLSPSASWFNPERLTAEKRRWLRDQRAASMDFDGESSLNAGANANANASSSLRMMESFLVCGLEPSAEVVVVADSAAKAKEARASGAANDVAITDPRRLRAYRGTAGATYTASILLQYPPVKEDETPTFAAEEVAAFCFPHGVEPRLLERTPSMSKLQEIMCGSTFTDTDDQVFVFQVQTSDHAPMYGVCAYVTEVLHQSPPLVQHARGDGENAETTTTTTTTNESSPSREPRSLRHRYIEVAPRCYCMLSKVPFFETHFEVLSHVLGMERVERIKRNMTDLFLSEDTADAAAAPSPSETRANEALNALRAYARCPVPDMGDASATFAPCDGVKPIPLPRPTPFEPFAPPPFGAPPLAHALRVSAEEEAFHLEGWAIVTLCCSLSLENVLSFLTAVLLEKQIVVFSNNLGELSAVSFALVPMLRPFRWQSLFLPILPQHMVDFLDAPVPFVCGVQHKTSDLRNRTNNLCRINVYKGDVKLHWDGRRKPLRLPRMKELVRNLFPLHEAIVEASVNHKKRPVIDPSHDAVVAAREFLNAWRAYLNSLVANIRYHAITDVNDGGEGKVTILLKESFLATFAGRDRSFMRAFVETQMFTTFCDERLASRD